VLFWNGATVSERDAEIGSGADLRAAITRILARKSGTLAWYHAHADDLLTTAVDALDRAKRLRSWDANHYAKLISDLEALATGMEATELEFRQSAARLAAEIPAIAQEGHLVARQLDLLAELIPLAETAEAAGLEAIADPAIAQLDRARNMIEIELIRLRQLKHDAIE
jgi:hypothetical protein